MVLLSQIRVRVAALLPRPWIRVSDSKIEQISLNKGETKNELARVNGDDQD